jgi:hypothetical protein
MQTAGTRGAQSAAQDRQQGGGESNFGEAKIGSFCGVITVPKFRVVHPQDCGQESVPFLEGLKWQQETRAAAFASYFPMA